MRMYRMLAVLFLTMFIGTQAYAQGKELITNGNLDNNFDQWLYEQWDKKPIPGVIDREVKKKGAASFKMSTASGDNDRYFGQAVTFSQQGDDYILSMFIKCDKAGANAVEVRLGIEGRGWLGSNIGKQDVFTTGGTHDWKEFRKVISASDIGNAPKATLFVYNHQMNQGSVWFDEISLRVASEEDLTNAAPASSGGNAVLTGDTSRPDTSTFYIGEPVKLTFQVTGIKDVQNLTLQLKIADEHDVVEETHEIPVEPSADGTWKTTLNGPTTRLGFYRVYAALSDGTQLAKLASRKAGFLTYAIVPDPTKRVNYGEKESFFGMQGGFGPWGDQICAALGARWVLDSSLEWNKNEPDSAGQMATKKFDDKHWTHGWKWKVFTYPTLMAAPAWAVKPETHAYMTGTLTPAGEKAWAEYCKLATKQFTKWHPDRQEHIYQITWEPIYPWGFKGTKEDLTRIYEIAYKAIHEADPKGFVAGPTQGITEDDTEMTIQALKAGLIKYMDMYSVHPYFPIDPEKHHMIRAVDKMKTALTELSGGKNIPMLGTEQGWSTQEEVENEIPQARGLQRQNLIMFGEGYRFNFAFYITDYIIGEQKGYGYYYNLVEGQPWGGNKIGPRPIAPAYAAQSFLLDGHKSVGAIEWISDTTLGYAFQRQDHIVLALWDYGDHIRRVSLPVGAEQVNVYDWMGNRTILPAANGNATVTIGPEPIYIEGVSAKIWGASAEKMITIDKSQVEAYPTGKVTVSAQVQVPADMTGDVSLNLEADPRINLEPISKAVTRGKQQAVTFDFTLPSKISPANYPIRLLLKNQTGTMAAAGITLRVQPPVAIAGIDPAVTADRKPALAITLQDRQGQGGSGTMAVEVRGMDQKGATLKWSLTSKGSQRLVVPLAAGNDFAPTRIYTVRTSLTTEAGYRFTQTDKMNFFSAAKVRSKPNMDAANTDWPATDTATLAGKEMVIRSADQFRDTSAKLQYAWDDQNLYLFVDVTDPNFFQNYTDVNIWKGDSLQLAFNLDPRKQEMSTGNLLDTNMLRRVMEINIALTKQGPQAFRSMSYDPEHYPAGLLTSAQAQVNITNRNGHIFYKIAFPWKTLGADKPPRDGEIFGIAAAVNSMDSAGQLDPSALGLFGGIFPSKDAEKFGMLLLKGQ